ncbi:uncharacterized protein LOC107851474 [Capsicum annuum]|uniref:uncharacterized protein LOC107851474 n=1 Tax=Capsicum annuum TaxID=4072 RepID=UPI001FB0F94E|nr:uncharacterized protein LOC107851474 [Capsicum annuum]
MYQKNKVESNFKYFLIFSSSHSDIKNNKPILGSVMFLPQISVFISLAAPTCFNLKAAQWDATTYLIGNLDRRFCLFECSNHGHPISHWVHSGTSVEVSSNRRGISTETGSLLCCGWHLKELVTHSFVDCFLLSSPC